MTEELEIIERNTDGLPKPKRYWAILAIALGVSVSVLDVTIANVALPTIARDLKTQPTYVIWVVNAYQLAMTISLLSFSSLGDLFGYRKVYLYGLLLFTCSSLACALSDSFMMLTLARISQGLGAAAITSVNTALLRIIYPRRHIGRGMGLNGLIVAFSLAAGPVLASIILSFAEWNWLFAVNVPIGLTAIYMGYRHLPQNPVKITKRRFDFLSSGANALTFALLIFTLEGIAHRQRLIYIMIEAVALLVVGFIFVRRQLQEKYPLMPVDLLRIPIFTLSIVTSLCSFTAQMLATVSLPFFFQNTLGYSNSEIGILLAPWPLAIIIVAPIAGRMVEHIHAGILGGIGLATFATGLFLLSFLPNEPSRLDIIWRMIVCGIGFGLFQSPNNSTIISSAPQHRSGGASGMMGIARLLGQTLGATLVAMMFTIDPANSTQDSLLLAGTFAIFAAAVSCLRLSHPTPPALRPSSDL